MKNLVTMMKLLSDETRMRIIMLLTQRELCVCQLMAVLGVSQPLISRNLSLLSTAGFLQERREGKLVFYSLRKKQAPAASILLSLLKDELKGTTRMLDDLKSLRDCHAFQKKTGTCDMKTLRGFMEEQKRKRREDLRGTRGSQRWD
jgi:ArsR family transcriptional regulator